MEAALSLSSEIGIQPACQALDVARSGFYRAQARTVRAFCREHDIRGTVGF